MGKQQLAIRKQNVTEDTKTNTKTIEHSETHLSRREHNRLRILSKIILLSNPMLKDEDPPVYVYLVILY